MAKKPSNLPVSGYFPTARFSQCRGVCCWDPPWFPQNKGIDNPQTQIPKTAKKAVQLIANTEYPPKNNPSTKKSASVFVCLLWTPYSRKTDRELLNSASSILLGDVGNVDASAPLRSWMFQTLTFFNCSCFLSRLRHIRYKQIRMIHKKNKWKRNNPTLFFGGGSIIHQKYSEIMLNPRNAHMKPPWRLTMGFSVQSLPSQNESEAPKRIHLAIKPRLAVDSPPSEAMVKPHFGTFGRCFIAWSWSKLL